MDGKPWPGSCWFEDECPYEILHDPDLGPIFEVVSVAVETHHRVEGTGAAKREWDESITSRDGIRFAWDSFGVTKPAHRRRATEWILIAVGAMNEGRSFVSEQDEAELAAARADAERRAQEYVARQAEREAKRKRKEARDRRREVAQAAAAKG